jgi:hypothetical protein
MHEAAANLGMVFDIVSGGTATHRAQLKARDTAAENAMDKLMRLYVSDVSRSFSTAWLSERKERSTSR